MMRQPIRKVKLFFPTLRDKGLPPTVKNTIPLDEQINAFIAHHHSKIRRKLIDVKYQFQIINSKYYEGEFERGLLIYEVDEA